MSGVVVTARPLAVRRKAAAAMIGCGTTKVDELIATGRIDAVKSGKHLLITVVELERYIASLPPAVLSVARFPHAKRDVVAAKAKPASA